MAEKKKTPTPEAAPPASDSQIRAAVAKIIKPPKSPPPGSVAPVDKERILEILKEMSADAEPPRVASEEATAKTWIAGELLALLTANKWLIGGVTAFLIGLYAHLQMFSGLPARIAAAEAKLDQLLRQQEAQAPPTSTPHGGP